MTERVETGVLQFKGDWPGIFIRGKEAVPNAFKLRSVLAALQARTKAEDISEEELAAWTQLARLANLLETCRVSSIE